MSELIHSTATHRKKQKTFSATATSEVNCLKEVPSHVEIRATGVQAQVDALISIQQQGSANLQDWNLRSKDLRALRGRVGESAEAKALIKAKQAQLKKLFLRQG